MSNKAPAFQFYFDRFNSSTALWDDCQVGKYIRLMICQANKGYVSAKELNKVGENDQDVLSKFVEIAPGQFANEVLTGILSDRDAYRESRQKNRLSGLKKKESQSHDKHMSNICQSYDEHMVDVDVDVVVGKDEGVKKVKGGTGEKQKPPHPGVIEVIQHLNTLNGTNLRTDTKATCRLIEQRFGEGYTVTELKEIIEYKVAEWRGTEWDKYLQPDTLFNGEKCAKYRNQVQNAKDKGLTASQIKAKPTNGRKSEAEVMAEVRAAIQRKHPQGI
jgi:uncharacterized phage protein (TIGR02220 family)